MPSVKPKTGGRGVRKGTKTGRKKIFDSEMLPEPTGYYAPPRLTGLTPFHRAIARAWASGDFKTKKALAEDMGISERQLLRLFETRAFEDEVDRIAGGIAEHQADLANDVARLAGEAIEQYAKQLNDKNLSASAKRSISRDLVNWAIKMQGLDKTGDGRQRAEKIVNQQFNFGDMSEDELRQIIAGHTGIVKKR